MNNLNDQPLKTIKNYLLSHERPTNDLKEKQMELISKLTQNSPLNANTAHVINIPIINKMIIQTVPK